MVSVSKLDDDENNSILIIANEKEFKKIAKLFRKRIGHNIDEFYNITKLTQTTFKLEPKLDFLNDVFVEDLAVVMGDIIRDVGDYRVSVDGLLMVLQKLKKGKARMTKQLKYSFKLAERLLDTHVFSIIV